MKRLFSCLSLVLVVVAALTTPSMAQQEKVYVPSASLVFRSLDSLSKNKISWKGLSAYSKTSTYNSRYIIALNLGSRVSDAFVAAQGKDDNNFLQMAYTANELSAKIGAEMDKATSEKMVEMVKQSNWAEVRTLLDKQQEETKRKLNRLDKDASVLVVVGGWLEGLHMVSKALSSQYNENSTSIIRSPKLVDYLITELNNISVGARNHPTVRKLAPQLGEVKNLVNFEKGKPVPHDNVKKIYAISSALIKEIENSKD